MELKTIWEWRLRVLMTRTTNLEGRVSALEDRSMQLSQRSDSRWQKIEWWAEFTPKAIGLLRLLWHTWPLILALGAAIYTLILPGLRWLLRALYSGLGWLAGLPTG